MKRALFFLLPLAFASCKQSLTPAQAKAEEVRLKLKKAGVRFERAYGCKVINGIADTVNATLSNLTEYDENGRAKSAMVIYSPGNRENFVEKYTYNSKGELQETQLQMQSGTTSTIRNEYNSKGWNTARVFYDNKNELSRRITYDHNKEGNITVVTSAEANGTVGYRMEYTYNDKGDEATSRRIGSDGREESSSKLVTRTDNLRVTDVFENGRKTFSFKETLNKEGLVTRVETFNDNDPQRNYKTDYTYNADGFMLTSTVSYTDSTGYYTRVQRSKE